ncbi:MAG: hypothetical protein NVSMB42_14460 [Herpetosiphon sp.]
MAANWHVESAGTWARDGLPAARRAGTLMREWGLTLDQHRSQSVTEQLLRSADIILVMEAGHREALRIEFPTVADRVFLLSELIDRSFDIPDPINGSAEDMADTAIEIDTLLTHGFARLLELANRPSDSRRPNGS